MIKVRINHDYEHTDESNELEDSMMEWLYRTEHFGKWEWSSQFDIVLFNCEEDATIFKLLFGAGHLPKKG